jgi:hypothetical protein
MSHSIRAGSTLDQIFQNWRVLGIPSFQNGATPMIEWLHFKFAVVCLGS